MTYIACEMETGNITMRILIGWRKLNCWKNRRDILDAQKKWIRTSELIEKQGNERHA